MDAGLEPIGFGLKTLNGAFLVRMTFPKRLSSDRCISSPKATRQSKLGITLRRRLLADIVPRDRDARLALSAAQVPGATTAGTIRNTPTIGDSGFVRARRSAASAANRTSPTSRPAVQRAWRRFRQARGGRRVRDLPTTFGASISGRAGRRPLRLREFREQVRRIAAEVGIPLQGPSP
jgi:hypothetical protein